MALAYVDWSQQELGIAAALSEDPRMMDAYRSGDFYLTFAKMAGAMGYKYGLQRDDDAPNYEKEIPKAREQYKEHKAALEKKRKRKGG